MTPSVSASPLLAVGDRPRRPGWISTTLSLLLGLLVGVVVLLAVSAVLAALHVAPPGVNLLDGPLWEPTSAWTVLASTGPLLLALGVLTVAVGLAFSLHGDWTLPLAPVLLGSVAVLATTAGGEPIGLLLLVVLVVGARYLAVPSTTAETARSVRGDPADAPSLPAGSSERRRPFPRWALLAGVPIALVLLAATLSYQPLHPLTVTFSDRPTDVRGLSASDESHELSFVADVESFGDARIVGARAIGYVGSDLAVESERPGAARAGSLDDLFVPLVGRTIAGGASVHGRLALPAANCPGGTPALVQALELRFETLGTTRTQRFAVEPPAALGCFS